MKKITPAARRLAAYFAAKIGEDDQDPTTGSSDFRLTMGMSLSDAIDPSSDSYLLGRLQADVDARKVYLDRAYRALLDLLWYDSITKITREIACDRGIMQLK